MRRSLWLTRVVGLAMAGMALLGPTISVAQDPALNRWVATLKPIADEQEKKLFIGGDIPGYTAALRKAVDPGDWRSQFIAGNLVYRVDPEAALEFHQAAAKLAPTEWLTHLEIAYDYQNMGQCDRALPAWQEADREGHLPSPTTAVAAYCYFRLGKIDEGIALWRRVAWPSHRVRLDFSLSEIFIGQAALRTHIAAYAKARAGDERALHKLIGNALEWRIDWWNVRTLRNAFEAARDLAKTVRPDDKQLHHEIECAARAIGARESADLAVVLADCRLLTEDGRYPATSEIGKFLVARMDAVGKVPVSDFLMRYGKELGERARSPEGDQAALEILAYLQIRARDLDGLAASDELGWRRYQLPKFAASRITGVLRAAGNDARTRAGDMVKEALRDFPNDPLINRLYFQILQPSEREQEAAILRWLLAEYNGLSSDPLSVPTSRGLASLVLRLQEVRHGK